MSQYAILIYVQPLSVNQLTEIKLNRNAAVILVLFIDILQMYAKPTNPLEEFQNRSMFGNLRVICRLGWLQSHIFAHSNPGLADPSES
jgi:hypothetical protein